MIPTDSDVHFQRTDYLNI